MAVRKKSPYLKIFQQAVAKIVESGQLGLLEKRFSPLHSVSISKFTFHIDYTGSLHKTTFGSGEKLWYSNLCNRNLLVNIWLKQVILF
jgi:hypothetical protein